MGGERSLDPRVWLMWGTAASLPALLGRNPWALAATLLVALGVRAAWTTHPHTGAPLLALG